LNSDSLMLAERGRSRARRLDGEGPRVSGRHGEQTRAAGQRKTGGGRGGSLAVQKSVQARVPIFSGGRNRYTRLYRFTNQNNLAPSASE